MHLLSMVWIVTNMCQRGLLVVALENIKLDNIRRYTKWLSMLNQTEWRLCTIGLLMLRTNKHPFRTTKDKKYCVPN